MRAFVMAKNKKPVNFALDPDLIESLREFAQQAKESMSSIVGRGIEREISGVTIPDDPLLDSFRAPFLTKAPCGPWEEALDHASHFTISQDTADELGARDGDVFVRTMGDSMEMAGIADGALLLMRPIPNQGTPRRHEITLVQIVDEDGDYLATIKHWQPSGAPGKPPKLLDGNDEEFPIPEGTQQVIPVAVALGIIGRI